MSHTRGVLDKRSRPFHVSIFFSEPSDCLAYSKKNEKVSFKIINNTKLDFIRRGFK